MAKRGVAKGPKVALVLLLGVALVSLVYLLYRARREMYADLSDADVLSKCFVTGPQLQCVNSVKDSDEFKKASSLEDILKLCSNKCKISSDKSKCVVMKSRSPGEKKHAAEMEVARKNYIAKKAKEEAEAQADADDDTEHDTEQ